MKMKMKMKMEVKMEMKMMYVECCTTGYIGKKMIVTIAR